MHTLTCPICGDVIKHRNEEVVRNILKVHIQEKHPRQDY